MKKRLKRVIGYVLVVAMLAVSVSITERKTVKAAYGVGSTVYFGAYFQSWLTGNAEKYAQNLTYNDKNVTAIADGRWVARYNHYRDDYYLSEPIEWIVLKNESNALMLMSKKALSYGNPAVSIAGEDNQWKTNHVRAWLNDGFLTYAFNKKEKLDIIDSQVSTYYMSYNDWVSKGKGYICGADEGGELQTTTDKVFLLDKYEFQQLVGGDNRIAYCTQWANKKVEPVDWYLRGPATWVYGNLANIYVTSEGNVDENRRIRTSTGSKGIRPVIRVKKNSKYLSTTKPVIKLYPEKKQGSPNISVTGVYDDGGTGKKRLTDTEIYNDDYFLKGKASNINGGLAKLSMLAAASVYEKSYVEGSKKINGLVKQCGFTKHHKYYKAKTKWNNNNKVSFEVAYKKVKNTNIVAVWVKGTGAIGKDNEWWSNISAFGKVHYGFKNAEKYLNKKVNSYLKNKVKINKSSKVKFWITGHSRGAAVANLYAKRMNKRIGKKNVFAYTFATPNVKKGKIKKNGTKYSNIHNYLNKYDIVTLVPIKGLAHFTAHTALKMISPNVAKILDLFTSKYRRYGDDNHIKLNKKMKSLFKNKTRKKYQKMNISHTHTQTAYLAWLKSKY